MASNLSIKNVPNELLERLRQRARRNHRSLQGELLTMLEDHLDFSSLTINELADHVQRLGLATQGDATAMVREDRDAR